MNEVRKHYFLDRWVITSSERGKRPFDFEIREVNIQKRNCPFCPRSLTQPLFYKVGNPWRIAVIPNKFPCVSNENKVFRKKDFFESFPAIGFHEIIIESSEHDEKFENFSAAHITEILDVFSQRTKSHMSNEKVQYVSIFKNKGALAGASIAHPHSQIIALPVVPRLIESERRKMEEYSSMFGECIFNKIYKEEKKEGKRILTESSRFYSLAPYSSIFSGETWILPKRHVRTLFELTSDEKQELAEMLKKVLRTLTKLFPGLPYNMAIHQAPKNRDFHLHIEIYPRLSHFAGFELSNDMYINSFPPEEFAELFRREIL